MSDTTLRLANLAEAVTLALLVCVAMPLKYWAGQPLAVSIVGAVHGVCFLFFVWALVRAFFMRAVGIRRSLALLVGAFVPFGGFVNDYWMQRREV